MGTERFIKPREPKGDGSHHHHPGRRSIRQRLESIIDRGQPEIPFAGRPQTVRDIFYDDHQLTLDEVNSQFRDTIPSDQEITLWFPPELGGEG